MEKGDGEAGALRAAVRSRLGRLGVPLQILAEDVLGEGDARIDWVAIEPGGRVWVVLVDAVAGGGSLLERGLAQRAWVEARIGDWQQLAPGLAARADLRPRLLLIAPDLSRVARVAAREADPDGTRLARFRWGPPGANGLDLALEPLEPPPVASRRPPSPLASAPLASVFRSGLSERDFGGNGSGPAA